jgi:hypothetical protein
VPDECECDLAGFAADYGWTRCDLNCCFGDADGDGDVDGMDLVQTATVNCF